MHGHDYTNNPNPVQGDLTFGPSRFGKGSSLRVESDKTLTIPHIDDYAVN